MSEFEMGLFLLTNQQQFQLTKSNEQIYETLSQGMRMACARQSGDYRQLLGGQIMRLEFASYINRIISPPLRPVSAIHFACIPADVLQPGQQPSGQTRRT